MIVIRVIGRILLALALIVLGLGLWLWLSGREITVAAGKLWFELDAGSLNLTQAVVQRYIHPALWENVGVPLLLEPTWEALTVVFLVLLVLGGVLLFLGRRRGRRRNFR